MTTMFCRAEVMLRFVFAGLLLSEAVSTFEFRTGVAYEYSYQLNASIVNNGDGRLESSVGIADGSILLRLLNKENESAASFWIVLAKLNNPESCRDQTISFAVLKQAKQSNNSLVEEADTVWLKPSSCRGCARLVFSSFKSLLLSGINGTTIAKSGGSQQFMEEMTLDNPRLSDFTRIKSLQIKQSSHQRFHAEFSKMNEGNPPSFIWSEDAIELSLPFPQLMTTTVRVSANYTLRDNKGTNSELGQDGFLCDDQDLLRVKECTQKYAKAAPCHLEVQAEAIAGSELLFRPPKSEATVGQSLTSTGSGLPETLADLQSFSKAKAASAFLKLLELFQRSSEAEVEAFLAIELAKKSPDKQNLYSLLDVLAHCTTEACFNAAIRFLRFQSSRREQLQEHFLNRLAQAATTATSWHISGLMQTLKNTSIPSDNVVDTLQLAVAHLTNVHCTQLDTCHANLDNITAQVASYFTTRLANCAVDSETCKLSQLRALTNLASATTLANVSAYLCSSSVFVPAQALDMVARIPSNYWSAELKRLLESVFMDRCPVGKADAAVRTFAGSLLVGQLDVDFGLISRIVQQAVSCSKVNRETFAYVIAKARENASARKHLEQVLRSQTLLGNYDTMAFGAMSSMYEGTFAETDNSSIVYVVDSFFYGGVVRRSLMDVNIAGVKEIGQSPAKLLSFGLYSYGLESMLGSSNSEESAADFFDSQKPAEEVNKPDATGGLNLGLFGFQQRPITFFTGQTELMSVAWGANGEPISIIEGNFLIHNLTDTIILPNSGLMLNVDILSALSLKMTGSVSLSFWYRNAESRVANNGTFHIKTNIRLGIDEPKPLLTLKSTANASLSIGFSSELAFAEEPYKFCLQMDQTSFRIKKSWQLKHSQTKRAQRNGFTRIPGNCFVTHPRVSLLCTELARQKYD